MDFASQQDRLSLAAHERIWATNRMRWIGNHICRCATTEDVSRPLRKWLSQW
jgi:hypothetical protein